jgi:RNA polymerase sigma-B factor
MSQGQSHLPVGREPSEAELFRSWHQHRDERAREELVSRYLPLARSLARRYSGAREPLEDLLQVASLGLLKAIDRFDASRGLRFSSFAVPTILGELKRYFRDTGWAVHVPRSAQENALELQQVQERLTTRTGRPPTVGELAEFMEVPVDEVLERLEAAAAHHTASLDAPLEADEEETGSMIDMLGGEESGYQRVEDGLTISAAAEQLSPRDLMALELRFRQDLTQSEIAEQLGISQMQVSRILRRALDAMRDRAGQPAQPAG